MTFRARPFSRSVAASGAVLLCLASPLPAQWVVQHSPTEHELRGLSVVGPGRVWASGVHGTVLATEDGGRRWRLAEIADAATLDLRAIAGTSSRVAHALSIGDSSRLYVTRDGGAHWRRRYTATRTGTFLDAVRFWDEKHGIALSDPVNGAFLLLVTEDAGVHWREVPASALPAALPGEGAFAASGSCLAVAGGGDVWFGTGGAAVARVFHSADRGRTWTVSETPLRAGVASAGIFSVAFRDARHGVIVGGDYRRPTLAGGNAAWTRDGGRSWALADSVSSPAGYRSAVAFAPGAREVAVAVGLTGTSITRDGGASWITVDTLALNSVAVDARGTAWAVGPRGRVARMQLP